MQILDISWLGPFLLQLPIEYILLLPRGREGSSSLVSCSYYYMCGPGKLKIETCFRYDPICCQWSIRSMLGYGLCPSRQWKSWAASPLAISLPVCTMIPLLRSCGHWFHTYYKLCSADCGRWLVLICCKRKVLLADWWLILI